jgi:hypothetical protein
MYKIVLALLVLISPFKAFSEPFVQAGTGAYFGEEYIDLGYRWSRLNLSLGIGKIEDDEWEQFNLKFNYVTTTIGVGPVQLQPLNLGLALMYTSDRHFFVQNSSRYPDEDYYDTTAFRAALTYQAAVKYHQWSLFYDITWLDQGIYAEYNNHNKYGDKFLSWGAGIRYEF